MRISLKGFIFVFLVIILSFGAIRPLLVPGFFPMHDDTQPARVYEMAKALSFGQFPVRWVGELGYGFGYPLFNFYAPLPYYIGGIFNLMGFDILVATKIMFIVGILLAGVSMYFLGREMVGDIAGLVSAVLYMYAPYHAVNIYVRGSVGEFYAYGFLPLVHLGILKIIKSTRKSGIIIGAIGIAGVLLSHNILGMITGFFLSIGVIICLIWLLIRKQNLPVICYLVSVICLGFGLSSFFTIPALMEKKYTRVEELTTGGSNFRQHFLYLDQLWDSPWGFAGSAPGREDGMSFKIGKMHLILGLLSLPALLLLYKRKSNDYLHYSLFIISVFLMLEQSKLIWEALPWFAYIQYPWRFLNFALFSLSVLTGVLFIPFKKSVQIVMGGLIIFITLWLNIKYFVPKEYLPVKDEDYTNDLNLRYKISKISDEYLPKEFKVPSRMEEIAWQGLVGTSEVVIKKPVIETPTEKKYYLNVVKPTNIILNIAFFPGWQAQLDGQKIEILNSKGRIKVNLPAGEHKLEFVFSDTLVRRLANTISLFSLVLLVYVSLFWKRNLLWPKNIRLK